MRKLFKVLGLVAGLGVIATTIAVTATPSQAATNHSKTFNFSKTVHSAPLDTCITFKVWGKMTYERRVQSFPRGGTFISISNRKLVNPTVTVKSWKGPRCRTQQSLKPLTGATLKQTWYTTSCSASPGIQVGFPWGVSFAPTIDCSNDVRGGKLSHFFSANNSTYRLNNSGRAPTFTDAVNIAGSARGACLSVDVGVKAERGNDVDNVGANWDLCVR